MRRRDKIKIVVALMVTAFLVGMLSAPYVIVQGH